MEPQIIPVRVPGAGVETAPQRHTTGSDAQTRVNYASVQDDSDAGKPKTHARMTNPRTNRSASIRVLALPLALALLVVATVAPSERPRTPCWCTPRHTPCGPAVHPARVAAIRFTLDHRGRWARHAEAHSRHWSST